MGTHWGKPYSHVFMLKKISSKSSRSISIKLYTIHPRVYRITNCSSKGPGSPQRGDNYKNAKMG
jgi:hypothetical protein